MIPSVGDTFRHYRILEKAGEGGMGVVLRAHDTKLGRDVALKFLTGVRSLDRTEADRMRVEARSLAALHHPNILAIYDLDEHDGDPFLVLEWIHGAPLAREPKTWTEDEFLRVGLQVAEALAAAHTSRVVHRDLKADNVLVTDTGTVKLVDFGIARLRDAEVALTRTGEVAGTANTMAPEQITGGAVGPAADVFSFGVLAYRMLAGRSPFEGGNAAALAYAIVHGSPRSLREVRPDLSPAVLELVERCLAKDPAQRPEDGNALAQDVRDAMPGRAPVRRRSSAATPEVRYARTADGASIAYTTNGRGPLLVRMLGWFTHLDIEWEWPSMRRIWERLGESHTVVRYDGRGMGLSSRWDGPFDETTRRLDLEAVLEEVGGPVTLMGISEGGFSAAHYAADHPERVSHLVIYGGYSRGAMVRGEFDQDEAEALLVLVRKQWGKDTTEIRNLFANRYFGEGADPRLVDHFNRLQRAAADGETATRYMRSNWQRGDGAEAFARLRMPSLILHCRDDRMTDFAEGQRIASLIPGARFLPLPSATHYFPVEEEVTDLMAEAIERLTGTQRD